MTSLERALLARKIILETLSVVKEWHNMDFCLKGVIKINHRVKCSINDEEFSH